MKRRLLPLVLVLAMLIQLSCMTTAFAAESEAQYTGFYSAYTAIGDSICAGYGTPSYDSDKNGTGMGENIKNSPKECYAQLLSTKLGAEMANLGNCGCDSKELYEALTDETQKNHDTYLQYIKKSDLITLNIGSNDLSFALMDDILAAVSTDSASLTKEQSLVLLDMLFSGGDIGEFIRYIGTLDGVKLDYDSLVKLFKVLSNSGVHSAFARGYEAYTKYYPMVVEKIKELNPDAQIVLLNYYNPYLDDTGDTMIDSVTNSVVAMQELNNALKNIQYDDSPSTADAEDKQDTSAANSDTSDQLNQILAVAGYPTLKVLASEPTEAYVQKMNAYIANYAVNTDTLLVNDSDVECKVEVDPHPTVKGHQQIADWITDALVNTVDVTCNEGGAWAVPSKPVIPIKSANVTSNERRTYRTNVKYNDMFTFYALPDAGYYVEKVTIDGKQVALKADNTYTIKKVRKNHTVSIEFAKNQYAVTYHPGRGTGTMDPDIAYKGQAFVLPECTFTTPDKNIEFAGWSVDGSKTKLQAGDSVELTGDATITAQWRVKGAPALSSATSERAGQVAVAWKQNSAVTGYQIRYSTSSNFSNSKIVTIRNYKTLKYTIKNLSQGKKYYIRMRTYQTVNDLHYYSAWGAAKSVTVSAKPAAVKLTKVKSYRAGQLSNYWEKNSRATGYQIQYGRSSKFSGAKTTTVSGSKNVRKTLTNLSKGRKYYVRVRTYKTVSGKTWYSSWSASKSATVRK